MPTAMLNIPNTKELFNAVIVVLSEDITLGKSKFRGLLEPISVILNGFGIALTERGQETTTELLHNPLTKEFIELSVSFIGRVKCR